MINILLCGNDKVFDGMLTTLLSIVNHCKDPLNVYIFTMDAAFLKPTYTCISQMQVDFIVKMLKETNPESRAIRYDVTELYHSEIGGSPNENTSYSPYALLRLLADKIDNVPDKLLYLDIDLLFNANIHKLYDIDISEYEYAAAQDHYGKVFLSNDYINTGVVLFNFIKIKETKLFEKARSLLNEKKMLFPDQSAIYNSTTSKLLLPQKFNSQKYLNENTIVRHFSKTLKSTPYPRVLNIKPWNVSEMHRYYKCYHFDDVLYEYIYYKKLYEKQLMKKEENMKNNEISLFFAVDDNYCPFLSVALDSIMDNCNKQYNYAAYVLNTGISEDNKAMISQRLASNFRVEFIDMNEKVKKFSEKLHTRDYYSKTTYYRLFIPEMFPNLDKALYIDSDIIVLGDISKLYNLNLENNLVGAVPDSAVQNTPVFIDYVREVIGVEGEKYFNAGVLLMNLKKMREFNFEDKFIDLLSKYTFTVAQDQDYLNAICAGQVAYADFSWNAMPIPNDKCKPNCLNLIHYNMLWKPWIFENIIYEEHFWKYAKQNPYHNKIKEMQQNYSEEKKQKDLQGGAKLLELAQKEIERPDNYKKKFLK